MYESKITVLILAAGGSSRLGQPKQLLPWKSSNLLQHTLDTVDEINSYETVLVLGANYNEIFSEINTKEIHVVHNKSWYKGLGHSIAVGVKYIKESIPETEAILIMLADQPLISDMYLLKMISEFKTGTQQIIASTYKNKKLGVPALFDNYYFEALMQLNDDEGAKHIIKANFKKVELLVNDINNKDIDTIEDYKQLYKANHQ
jgi:molybdenum cofactor cytidylyltransferase